MKNPPAHIVLLRILRFAAISLIVALILIVFILGKILDSGSPILFILFVLPVLTLSATIVYVMRISRSIINNIWIGIIIPIIYIFSLQFLMKDVSTENIFESHKDYLECILFDWMLYFPLFVILLLLFLWQLISDYRSESKVQRNMCRMNRCTYDNVTENNISSAKAKCNAGSRVVAYLVFIVMTGALLQFIIQVFFTSGNLQYGLFVTLGYIAYCVINNRWLKRYINKRIVLFPEVILPLIALTCWLAANWRSLQVFCMITVSAIENIVRIIL